MGFTAVELLVGSLLGLAALTATAQLLISYTNHRTAAMQVDQRRSDWRKLTYQIAADLGDDHQLSTGMAVPASCGTGVSLLTIRIPQAATALASPGAPAPGDVHYMQIGTGPGSEIHRCGPAQQATAAPAKRTSQVISGLPVVVSMPSTCPGCLRLSAGDTGSSSGSSSSSATSRPNHTANTPSLPPILLRQGISGSAQAPSRSASPSGASQPADP